MHYGFGIGGRACRVVESALKINALLVGRTQDERARVEYLNARYGIFGDGEQVDTRGVALEIHSRQESVWGGDGVGAEDEAVDACSERQFPVLQRPRTMVRVGEDIADVEVGSGPFYLPFVVEVEPVGVQVEGEDMQREGVVCLPVVFRIAGGELGGDGSGLRGCGLLMACRTNAGERDEDGERAMRHREEVDVVLGGFVFGIAKVVFLFEICKFFVAFTAFFVCRWVLLGCGMAV